MNARKKIEDTGKNIRLVLGLGNPGREYENTRHNIGFSIVDELAHREGASWSTEKKWEAEVARLTEVLLVKPQTYMNLSGRALSAVCRFHKITADEILVIFDDADLEPGRLRFRVTGSAAGHNGIKSIIQSLGTQDFARLKFGIGRMPEAAAESRPQGAGGNLSGHVLGKFTEAEREELQKNVAQAADAVNYALAHGITAAMNRYNESPETRQARRKKSSGENKLEENQSETLEQDTGTTES